MAIYDNDTLIHTQDPNGDIQRHFPRTKARNVWGGLGGGYSTCATAAATAAKTAALANFELLTGAIVSVKFSYANSAAAPTMNVNGTGAKAIVNYLTGAAVVAGDIAAGATHVLVYNGTQWVLCNPVAATVTAAEIGGDARWYGFLSSPGDFNIMRAIGG